ncbi:DUF4838 domain-containing protein [Occultella kanbiaonis]|uniref:DUF4838 domain-containing protein n=1 Tax=Occultella kanbiaonis TaxID=2675754 RepID=UPI0013D62313|nr:DUF4838 domain-containing protein [Occultella kanbiaonis]
MSENRPTLRSTVRDRLNMRRRTTLQLAGAAGAAAFVGNLINAGAAHAEPTEGPTLRLTEDGEPRAVIVHVAGAGTGTVQAASELVEHVQLITGAVLPIVNEAPSDGTVPIYLGAIAPDAEATVAELGDSGVDPDGYRILADADGLQLIGHTDRATLYAAYGLLESLGVRWYMPGDLGRIAPATGTLEVAHQDAVSDPYFEVRVVSPRRYHESGVPKVFDPLEPKPWNDRMRLWPVNIGAQDFPNIYPRTERPDLYLKDANGNLTPHLDVTLPDALVGVVEGCLKILTADPDVRFISMSPVDGLPPVLEPNPDWDADDYDPLNNSPSITDRYVNFLNLVLAELDSRGYSNFRIPFLAYANYVRPPKRFTPDPRIVIMVAPIIIDRFHAIGDAHAWERNYIADLIEGWASLGSPILMRDYRYNLADPSLPFPMIKQVTAEMQYYRDHNVMGIKSESLPAWGYQGPAHYLYAQMAWNPDLDVEATMTEMFTDLYGRAADTMRDHFETLDAAYTEADYSTGRFYDTPNILNAAVMRELDRSLRLAEGRARSEDANVQARVAMVRTAYEYGKAWLAMVAAFNACDMTEANRMLGVVHEVRAEAISHAPVIIYPWASYYYLDNYYGAQVADGYARTVTDGQVLAQLPDEWHAMTFPSDQGSEIGLWKPELRTTGWMPLKTFSQSWANQGLRYYHGAMWYRTTIDLPAARPGTSATHLWLGVVDEKARAWLNGQELPVVRNGSTLRVPFVFDATDAVVLSGENVVVIETINETVDELGTGGLVGPAMFYQVNA